MIKVDYNPEGDKVTITINGESETLTVMGLLDMLPSDMEIVRLYWLTSQIYKLRTDKMKNLGDYQDKIIELTKGEAKARAKMEDAAECGDHKSVKSYGEIVKAYLAEKNTINEFRHAQKFLTFEEGRLLAILEKLEV